MAGRVSLRTIILNLNGATVEFDENSFKWIDGYTYNVNFIEGAGRPQPLYTLNVADSVNSIEFMIPLTIEGERFKLTLKNSTAISQSVSGSFVLTNGTDVSTYIITDGFVNTKFETSLTDRGGTRVVINCTLTQNS